LIVAAAAAVAVGGLRWCLGRRGGQPTGVEIHGHRHHDPGGGGVKTVRGRVFTGRIPLVAQGG